MKWLYLSVAILTEIVSTAALKESDGFTRWPPSVLAVVGYAITFYALSLALREIPIGVAYAMWSGLGMVALAIVGYLRFGQSLDAWGAVGVGLILAGVVCLQVLSSSGAE